MAYVKNSLHCVWGTKNKIRHFTDKNKTRILDHMRENAKIKGIYIDFINAHREHVHCIISLPADQALSKTIQLIKGEASYWINKNLITQGKFEWADEYYAASISDSHLDNVREYIKNQKIHHTKKTWEEECTEFFRMNKF